MRFEERGSCLCNGAKTRLASKPSCSSGVRGARISVHREAAAGLRIGVDGEVHAVGDALVGMLFLDANEPSGGGGGGQLVEGPVLHESPGVGTQREAVEAQLVAAHALAVGIELGDAAVGELQEGLTRDGRGGGLGGGRWLPYGSIELLLPRYAMVFPERENQESI